MTGPSSFWNICPELFGSSEMSLEFVNRLPPDVIDIYLLTSNLEIVVVMANIVLLGLPSSRTARSSQRCLLRGLRNRGMLVFL
jgi:hypothetical protein